MSGKVRPSGFFEKFMFVGVKVVFWFFVLLAVLSLFGAMYYLFFYEKPVLYTDGDVLFFLSDFVYLFSGFTQVSFFLFIIVSFFIMLDQSVIGDPGWKNSFKKVLLSSNIFTLSFLFYHYGFDLGKTLRYGVEFETYIPFEWRISESIVVFIMLSLGVLGFIMLLFSVKDFLTEYIPMKKKSMT